MTLAEYTNQTEIKRQSPGSVKVKRSECFSIVKVHGGEVATLHLVYSFTDKQYFTYFIPDGEKLFYTMDEHGNKRRISVFSFDENE